MGSSPKIFKKNIIDIDNPNVNLLVSDSVAQNDGASFVNQIRNRNNITGWATTGSNDSATTYIDIDWIDVMEMETIILIGHNFKSYNIQRWNGSSFEDFDTPISIINSTDFVTEHEVPKQSISRIRINILSTQTADDDKKLRQLIVTRKIGNGQFSASPVISNFEKRQNRRAIKTLSGKNQIRESVGGLEYRLQFKTWPFGDDFDIIEEMYFKNFSGVLFWACGGNDNQFRYKRVGYRKEDIVLVKPSNEFDPTWEKGIYSNGLNFNLRLAEVI